MKRIDGIDITRGLLALSVAIYHYIQFLDISFLKKIHPFLTAGITSVDAFFMISGFALFYSYHAIDFTDTRNITIYFYKRFARIAPLFYLCLLLNMVSELYVSMILLLLFLGGCLRDKAYFYLGQYAFLIISLLLGGYFLMPSTGSYEKLMIINNVFFIFGFINTNFTMVRGGWSIGIEYIFYFFLPFICCLIKNNTRSMMILTLLTVYLAINYQFLNDTNLYSYHSAEHPQELIAHWPLYTNPLNHFYFFMAGILLSIAYDNYRDWLVKQQKYLIGLMIILIFMYCFLDQMVGNPSYGYGRFFYSIVMVMMIAIMPFLIIKNTGLKKPLILLGDMSYSVYLMQFPVYNVVSYWSKQIGFSNKYEIFCFAITALLFFSYLTYRLYELPGKQWLMSLYCQWKEKKDLSKNHSLLASRTLVD